LRRPPVTGAGEAEVFAAFFLGPPNRPLRKLGAGAAEFVAGAGAGALI